MKLHSTTIGIPAYNEAANIRKLLTMLLQQREHTISIDEIIVVTDGCTDATVEQINRVKSNKISVVELSERQGLANAQNIIASKSCSEFLILLNADVVPGQADFCERIVEPMLKNPAICLVGADTVSSRPQTWFEKIIAASHQVKTAMYRQIQNGNNVYMCHGRARALRKNLYSQFTWPVEYPEDSYSYFMCLEKNYSFTFASAAYVYFRSPQNFSDHLKQSLRFFHGRSLIIKRFTAAHTAFRIPIALLVKSFFCSFIVHPILTSAYLSVTALDKILYLFSHQFSHSTYEPSATSKTV